MGINSVCGGGGGGWGVTYENITLLWWGKKVKDDEMSSYKWRQSLM